MNPILHKSVKFFLHFLSPGAIKSGKKCENIKDGTDFAHSYWMMVKEAKISREKSKGGFLDVYYAILDFLVNKTCPESVVKKIGLTLKEFYILRDIFLEGAKEGIKNALKSKQKVTLCKEEKRRFPRVTLAKEKLQAILNNGKESTTLAGKVIAMGVKNLSVRLKSDPNIVRNKIIKLLLRENGNIEEGLAQVIRIENDKKDIIVHLEVV
ncbi:MAG: hypothetical protein ACK4NF_03545 [Planctomycetota bacterium]